MENELKVILPEEVNELALKVPEEKQIEVRNVLDSIFAGTQDWENKVDAIEVKDINDTMSIQLADTARKNAKTARLTAEKIFDTKRQEVQLRMHDDKLEDALWLKSKQIMQLKLRHIEEKAKFKADFVKRHEAEQLKLKIETRLLQIHKFNESVFAHDVENMSDEVFNNYLSGLEKNHNDAIEAEKKAKEERIAKEKAEKEEQERILKENEQLIKKAKELERLSKIKSERTKRRNDELRPYITFIRDYNSMLELNEDAYKKEFSDIKKGALLQWEHDRKEEKRKYEQEQKDKVEQEKVKTELLRKEQAEKEAKEAEEKRLQNELSKGDSEKVKDLIDDLVELKTKYLFKSAKNKKMYSGVNELIDKVVKYID